ncbi:unnamed protein product [Rodentolepis nana]|uniref:WD repeat-containing protein 44 n=1 Tax=Rodentolepis nana TaxID=102285 RepID=A0A0R3TCV7_RODNA|nr:unnamed protein product [Rodentolepis nana]
MVEAPAVAPLVFWRQSRFQPTVMASGGSGGGGGGGGGGESRRRRGAVSGSALYHPQPLLVYRGHEGVITELAWSKNLFLLSTGMDRQVRLWHISRRECLCAFSHNDTVPAIVFHPKDDRYFLSGSLDGKLRLWNIPDKKVRFWVDPKTIITCATFACDSTKVVVGSYDGRVMFFNTELTYITFITVKSVSGRCQQCRVTAIEVDPTDSNKILVTSNDSRVRLIDARDYHTLCKYRGFLNETSQIRASFRYHLFLLFSLAVLVVNILFGRRTGSLFSHNQSHSVSIFACSPLSFELL